MEVRRLLQYYRPLFGFAIRYPFTYRVYGKYRAAQTAWFTDDRKPRARVFRSAFKRATRTRAHFA